MLKRSRREGVWDGDAMAAVAGFVACVEEEKGVGICNIPEEE